MFEEVLRFSGCMAKVHGCNISMLCMRFYSGDCEVCNNS